MRIEFICRSEPLGNARAARAAKAELSASGDMIEAIESTPVIEVEDATIEIRVLFDPAQNRASDESEFVRSLLRWLTSSSSQLGVDWRIGHALDSELGRIADGISTEALAVELATAIRIAKSLDGLIVDDEFVDEDYVASGDDIISEDLAEGDWSELLEPDAGFIRFPEWE